MVYDFWETDITNNITPLPIYSGMYYYFLQGANNKESSILGNCSAINSVWFSPILDKEDFATIDINYDIERFGKLNNGTLNHVPEVHRITSVNNIDKELKTLPVYEPKERKLNRHYDNESRLMNFPYSYATVNDYINPPYEIQYHMLPSKQNFTVKAKGYLSDKGTYSLYIENLKGDRLGNVEGAISTSPLDLPVSSSAYSSWSSTQKAQDNQNLRNNIFNANVNMAQQSVGIVSSALSLDFDGSTNNAFGAYKSYVEKAQLIGNRSAQMKDLQNTPRTMLNTGSDVSFSMVSGQMKIELLRYEITQEYKQRLGDFFALYGYKQNKLMLPNIRNRYYYNFIRTVDVNLKPKVRTIPKAHLNVLKSIYNNGITVWHMDRSGVQMFDYTYDNKEI